MVTGTDLLVDGWLDSSLVGCSAVALHLATLAKGVFIKRLSSQTFLLFAC
jgi:hypothetical protein